MRRNNLCYPAILFDWGNTVMRDYPEITIPMVEWDEIEVIDGIADVLAAIHTSGRRIILATSASISNEAEIWGALKRGGLDTYFSKIYCFKNTNLPKGEAFYRHILNDAIAVNTTYRTQVVDEQASIWRDRHMVRDR